MANATEPRTRNRNGHARYLVRSVVFLVAIGIVAALLFGTLAAAFAGNPILNGTILAVLAFGAGYTLVGLAKALSEARAIDRAESLVANTLRQGGTREGVNETLSSTAPESISHFLETVHRVVRHGGAGGTLPYLLDSLATRVEDRRALVRFLTGALVLLGLIGTFYGLLITIGGVREVLGGLSAETDADTITLLTSLRERLAVPLGGMALAFSTSLFGLAASLILAFLELQLFHAQSDVHARLESLVVSTLVPFWQVRVESGAAGGPAIPHYIGALLQTTAEHLERVTHQLDRLSAQGAGAGPSSESSDRLAEQVGALTQTLEKLEADRTAELRNELRLMTRTLAQRDTRIAPET